MIPSRLPSLQEQQLHLSPAMEEGKGSTATRVSIASVSKASQYAPTCGQSTELYLQESSSLRFGKVLGVTLHTKSKFILYVSFFYGAD